MKHIKKFNESNNKEDLKCVGCEGSGEMNCPECNGVGSRTCDICKMTDCDCNDITIHPNCDGCDGSGIDSCDGCDGSGINKSSKWEDDEKSEFIEHYFIGQQMEVKGLPNFIKGKDVIVNGIGTIYNISIGGDLHGEGGDIVYDLISESTHDGNPRLDFQVSHDVDKEYIVRVW